MFDIKWCITAPVNTSDQVFFSITGWQMIFSQLILETGFIIALFVNTCRYLCMVLMALCVLLNIQHEAAGFCINSLG